MTPRTPYCGEISNSSQKFVLDLRIIICLVWTDSSSEEGENNNVRNWSNNSFVYYMVLCETFIVLFGSCPKISELWTLRILKTSNSRKPLKKMHYYYLPWRILENQTRNNVQIWLITRSSAYFPKVQVKFSWTIFLVSTYVCTKMWQCFCPGSTFLQHYVLLFLKI